MSGGEYLALAYGAVFVVVLAYVAIIAAKLARLQRETREILDLARAQEAPARTVEHVAREISPSA
ncbi:MAG TPA: CcmD family protein [Gaiellaceae bacterium]|nr:CcmD family protein [Gaiellaceae bacterium]